MLSLIATAIDFQAIDFKLIYIGLHFTMIYFVIEFAIRFIAKSKQYDNYSVRMLNLGIGVAFLFLLGIFGSQLIYHYYLPDGMVVTENQFNHFLFVIFGALMFVCIAICEKAFISRRIFTWIALVTLITFILIPPDSDLIFISYGLTALVICLPLWVGLKLFRTTGDQIRRRLFYLGASAFFFYIGCILNLEIIIPYLPYGWITLVGGLFVVLGLGGIYFSLHKVDLFVESDWKKYLLEIFIIEKKKMNLVYHQIFEENLELIEEWKKMRSKERTADDIEATWGSEDESPYFQDFSQMDESIKSESQKRKDKRTDEHLKMFSGGLIGIDSITKNISKSADLDNEGTSLIELGDQYLLLNTTDDMIFCFITSKNLESMNYFLYKTRVMWERYYKDQDLAVFAEDITAQSTLKNLITRVLSGKLKL